jgi:hypothetical protein
MKRYLPFILILSFLFPVLGHADSTAPAQNSTPTVAQIDIKLENKTLLGIYTRLNDLSSRTQLAINQLNANGIVTTQAQTSLIATNTSLAKAKIDIAAKSPVNKIEKDLTEAKTNLLGCLTALKAALPTLDTSAQS